MPRIMFTGGSGKAGRHVVQYLVDHGCQVLNLDLRPLDNPAVRTLTTDITDGAQVFHALSFLRPQKVDAVVHFAAIPLALLAPDNEVFRVNTMGAYNVIAAAVALGIGKIVIASSAAAYGLAFSDAPRAPAYLPLDEEHPLDPPDSYALSKVCNERTAQSFATRSGADIIALRIGRVIAPDEYTGFADTGDGKRTLWSYLDTRDLGQLVLRAIKAEGLGFQIFNAAADDCASDLPTKELLRRFYPNVTLRAELGEYETLLSNRRAKKMLGFKPAHSWRAALQQRT